jgi:hypothetical protein
MLPTTQVQRQNWVEAATGIHGFGLRKSEHSRLLLAVGVQRRKSASFANFKACVISMLEIKAFYCQRR